MKLLGAALLLAACVRFGTELTTKLRRRIDLLDEVIHLLRVIRRDLLQRQTSLPELLEEAAKSCGTLRMGLLAAASALRQGKTPLESAEKLLLRLENHWELPDTARTLRRLCTVLGRFDSSTQAEACETAQNELEAQEEELKNRLKERGKLYHAIPLGLGIMAVLVLF